MPTKILDSATNIYKAFLEGIRKQNTTTVRPDVFTDIWNIWGLMKWAKSNKLLQEGAELSQKELDDFAALRRIFEILPTSSNLFKKPDGNTILTNNVTNVASEAPIYRRALNVMFKLDYDTATSQECSFTGVSDWLQAGIMRSDEEGVIRANGYLSPSDSRLYYQFIEEEYIRMVKDSSADSDAEKLYLDYLKYPNWMDYSGTTLSYTIDLGQEQLTEVLDLAILKYLERSKDPRWQSYLQLEKANQQIY